MTGADAAVRRPAIPIINEEPDMPETAQDVLALAEERGAQIVDLRFCDLPGLMQHFSIPV